MGYPKPQVRLGRLMYGGALVLAAVVVWQTPELRFRALIALGLERYAPVPAPPQVAAQPPRKVEPYRGDAVSPTQGSPCYPRPLQPTKLVNAWALYPSRHPLAAGCDGFVWRVAYDALAIGLGRLAGKACLDPVVVEDQAPSDWRPTTTTGRPSDPELQAWATSLGASHFIVPVVSPLEDGRIKLTFTQVDVGAGSKLAPPIELASAALAPRDPSESARVLAIAVRDALVKLGAKAPADGAASRAFSLEPKAPEAIVDDIRKNGDALGAANVNAWWPLALDYSMLGSVLTSGESPVGPRLLVRGTALALLALGSKQSSEESRLALATGLLLARHTALCTSLLEPLLAAKNASAELLDATCRADVDLVSETPGAGFLFRVVAERAVNLHALETRLVPLTQRGVPSAFLLAGLGRLIDVGLGRSFTEQWLIQNGTTGDKAGVADQLTSLMRSASFDAVSIVEDAGRKIRERANFKLPLAYAPVEAGLRNIDEYGIRSDLAALPGIEYAHIAKFRWGVAELAERLDRKLPEAFPWSLAVPTGQGYRCWMGMLTNNESWIDDLNGRHPHSAFAQTLRFACKLALGRAGAPEEVTAQSAELASASLDMTRKRVYRLERGLPSSAAVADAIRAELDLDPWDGRLWQRYLTAVQYGASSTEYTQALARARLQLPHSPLPLFTHGEILAYRASPVQAHQVYTEITTRFPINPDGWEELIRLERRGHRLDHAKRLIEKMNGLFPHSLTVASHANAVALELLALGYKKPALEVAELSRNIDEWKGDTIHMLGTFAMLEGRLDEGYAWFKRAFERYKNADSHMYCVRALTLAGRKAEALDYVRNLSAADLQVPYLLRNLGASLLIGDPAAGLEHLRQARDREPRHLISRDLVMLEDPALAGNPKFSKDSAWIRALRDKLDPTGVSELLDALDENPYPERIDPVLELVPSPAHGARCARWLAPIAWIDLDLPAYPSAAQLEKSHARLSAWWSQAKSDYIATRMN